MLIFPLVKKEISRKSQSYITTSIWEEKGNCGDLDINLKSKPLGLEREDRKISHAVQLCLNLSY